MTAAAGKALKGLGKAFLKRRRTIGGLKAASRRGTPTKAGLVARRAALRGETTAEKYRKALGPTPKPTKAPKKIDLVDFGVGAGTGALTMHLISKAKKEAKATETKKDKLKEATEKHKKKTKEKRKKYGKHHG